MKLIAPLVEFKNVFNKKDLVSFITTILVSEGFFDNVFICETENGIRLFTNKINIDLVITDRIINRLKQHKSAI